MLDNVPSVSELRREARGFILVGRELGYDDAQSTVIAREAFRQRGWPDPAPLIFDMLPAAHVEAWSLTRPRAEF